MSAEQEKAVPGEAPAEEPRATKRPDAKAKEAGERKPASRRKPALGKKAVADKKKAAEKQPTAEKAPAPEKASTAQQAQAESSEAKKPDAGKPAARKKAPAAKPAAETPPASRPARKRAGATPAPRRKVVRAHARYVRTSARKARMVCGHLRGKSVQEARAILAFTPREVARDWSKLLESAVANAESNHELLEDDLIVREAYADEGPTIKRFRPRAMGRATPIRKRTSHLTITLTPSAEPGTTSRRG
jgi:ribosomal protein L22